MITKSVRQKAVARELASDFERVVTAVDFYEDSREAAVWAMNNFAPGAEHELLHVVDLPELPRPLRNLGPSHEQLRLAAREGAQNRLDELRELGAGRRVETHIREGRPAMEILRLCDEVGADLIIVGEQGPRRGVGALLGSTAERVLFGARVPVLVARKLGDGPPRRFLAAVDPADVSDRILARAGAFLSRFDGTLTVLNVVDRLLLLDEQASLPTARAFKRLQQEAVAAMREWLEGAVRRAGLPAARVETAVVLGDPSYEITAAAGRLQTDLVLIGSKGGDVARTPMIGRIVNKVVRNSPCSVLVVMNRSAERAPSKEKP